MADILQDALETAALLRKLMDAHDDDEFDTEEERDAAWDRAVAQALVAYAEKQRAVAVEACARMADKHCAHDLAYEIRALSAPGPS